MAKKSVTPRLDETAAEWYKQWFEYPHNGYSLALEAFPVLIQRALIEVKGKFDRGELMLFLDVLNGLFLSGGLMGQQLFLLVADGCNIYRLNEKWGVDEHIVCEKIRGLTSFQKAAIEVWGVAFWNAEEKERDIEEYVGKLL